MTPGIPAEIGQIDQALGRLWEESADTKTRASLINLAILTEDPASIDGNTALIADISTEHACRALLILANPDAPESSVRAWINAHCHLVGAAGGRQVCSEQITFQLDGDMMATLPNIVFSHIESDLPLYFWRQGHFRKPLNEKLWLRVDRLIFDSADWTDPIDQFAILDEIAQFTESRTILCDLNWTRLFGARVALAQLFDHSIVLANVREIERIDITSSHRLSGLLLLGWLAAQLGWKYQDLLGRQSFLTPDGRAVEFAITVAPGAVIGACRFAATGATFEILREDHSDYYHARVCGEGSCESPMLIPAGKSKLLDVLRVELGRGGRHPLYRKARAAIAALIGS